MSTIITVMVDTFSLESLNNDGVLPPIALFTAEAIFSDDVKQVEHDDNREWNPDHPQEDTAHGTSSFSMMTKCYFFNIDNV